MPDIRTLSPPSQPINATLSPPGSKSLTNRAAIVAALADGVSMLTGVLDSDDTRVMRHALDTLGLNVEFDPVAHTLRIEGQGGKFPNNGADRRVELDLNNSGTSIRFLAGACAAARGDYVLTGNARMQERPISDLIAALNQFEGVSATDSAGTGCPPVHIVSSGIDGGAISVRGNISSQFLSSILMAAPLADSDVRIEVQGELVSRPYVDMTIAVMQAYGAHVDEQQPGVFSVRAQPYVPKRTTYDIEPDASAASYWLAAGALAGEVTVQRLDRSSLQGDVAFADVLEQMGATVEWKPGAITVRKPDGLLHGIDIDMGPISDTAQTAAVVAMFADSPTRIRGVGHMRHKETDRVGALVTELTKLGISADEHDDGLTIHPGAPACREPIHTYDDHRMAMSFALAGLMTHGIEIADPGCVAKTYPTFWDDWDRVVS